ncbi:MAG: response regulator transcription factor [Thermoleophilia bacterium]
MNVLLVEDDRALRDALRRVLEVSGYRVTAVASGEDALVALPQCSPDAVVLDIGLPGMDGMEVCRRVRGMGNRVPVLMLTARDAVSDRVAGLDAGADDYLVKPFDNDELKARLRALARRLGGDGDPDRLSYAMLRLDTARHGVVVGDDLFVELTKTEFLLLELFLVNPERILSPQVIYDRVWGYDFGPQANGLRVYIGYLRRKLDDAGAPPLIHTVRGVGYVLRNDAA